MLIAAGHAQTLFSVVVERQAGALARRGFACLLYPDGTRGSLQATGALVQTCVGKCKRPAGFWHLVALLFGMKLPTQG